MILRTAVSLLKPKILSLKNSLFFGRPIWYRFILCLGTALIIVGLPTSVYFSLIESLAQFQGNFKPEGLFEITATTFAGLLFIAACIHALQIFFLASDNELFHVAPIPSRALFLGKFMENAISASWILLLIFVPIFFSIGTVAHAPFHFYGITLAYLLLLTVLLSTLSIGIVIVLSQIYPARRLREAFILLAICGVVALHLYDRSTDFIPLQHDDGSIQDAGKLLTYWHSQIAKRAEGIFSYPLRIAFTKPLAESIQFLIAFAITSVLSYSASFRVFSDFYQPNNLLERWQQAKKPKKISWFRRPPATLWGFLQKDLHLFLRDLAQPVQLLAFIGVAGITILSYRQSAQLKNALTGSDFELHDVLFGLGLFSHLLLTVLFAGRFIFPALAMEEECRWLIGAAPVDGKKFVAIKFLSYGILSSAILVPLYVTIGCMTDLPFHQLFIGTVIGLTTTLGVSALAVGSGGFFRLRGDPLQSAGGTMGSFIFMTGALLVVPMLMVAALSIAVLFSIVTTGAVAVNGALYCGIYGLFLWILGGIFLRKASRQW